MYIGLMCFVFSKYLSLFYKKEKSPTLDISCNCVDIFLQFQTLAF